MTSHRLPLHIGPAPDPLDPELEPLLGEPFASALMADAPGCQAAADAVRGRLLDRVSASHSASSAMFTVRPRRLASVELAPGVQGRTLYRAATDRGLRPGEPAHACLIALRSGSQWAGPVADRYREWLVLHGSVELGDESLRLCDYHVTPAGSRAERVCTDEGAVLFLRESILPAGRMDSPITVRDVEAGWPDYAPGIHRRVLWQHDGQAAMLYYARPGACVPLHTHGHDEECLMVRGELFQDDVLLRQGDYQLAPAGTSHRIARTDTGVVIYAHGDLDLKFVE